MLFRTAKAIVGNEADARDADPGRLRLAWKHLPRLRDLDKFDAWLGRILDDCRMQLRRQRRVREIATASTSRWTTSGSVWYWHGDPDRQHRRVQRQPRQLYHLSPDGWFAVVELGQAIPNSPLIACNNLYLIATDGTGATRITTFGTHEHASDARFSVDGRFLASRFDDLRGHTPVVGLIDLLGDRTPRIVECGETSMFDFAWAPDGDRLAMVCGGRLDVVSAETGRAVSSTVLPFKGEIFMQLAWSDATTMVLVTALDNGIGVSNAHVQLRTVASGVVSNPTPVSPPITFAGPGSVTAPDGRAVAVFSVFAFSRDQTPGWYVIDTTAAAQAVAGPGCSDLGWSADGRSVVFVREDRRRPCPR